MWVWNKKKNIPNLLTAFRMICVPSLVVVYYLDLPSRLGIATIIFILASVTDYLDGLIARQMKTTTPIGAFLDPLADKMLVVTALFLLVSDPHLIDKTLFPLVFLLCCLIIILREVIISTLRGRMKAANQNQVVSVQWIGKAKSVTQLTALPFLIYQNHFLGFSTVAAGELILYVATILTVWSSYIYLSLALPYLLSTKTTDGLSTE